MNDLYNIEDADNELKHDDKAKEVLLETRAKVIEAAKKYRDLEKHYSSLANKYEKDAEMYDKFIYVIENNEKNIKEIYELDKGWKEFKSEKSKSEKIKWRKESVRAIKENKKMMLTGEILNFIFPFPIDENHRKKYIVILSGTLNKLSKPPINKLVMFNKKGIKGNYYGLPEWFKEGEPKEEYRP